MGSVRYIASETLAKVLDAYDDLLRLNVAPEQARLVLPMALVTEWIWTGISLRFCADLPGTIGTGRPTRNPRGGGRDSGGDGNGVPVSWPAIMEVGNDD